MASVKNWRVGCRIVWDLILEIIYRIKKLQCKINNKAFHGSTPTACHELCNIINPIPGTWVVTNKLKITTTSRMSEDKGLFESTAFTNT